MIRYIIICFVFVSSIVEGQEIGVYYKSYIDSSKLFLADDRFHNSSGPSIELFNDTEQDPVLFYIDGGEELDSTSIYLIEIYRIMDTVDTKIDDFIDYYPFEDTPRYYEYHYCRSFLRRGYELDEGFNISEIFGGSFFLHLNQYDVLVLVPSGFMFRICKSDSYEALRKGECQLRTDYIIWIGI